MKQAVQDGWSHARVRRRMQSGLWVPVLGRGIAADGTELAAPQYAWATHLTVPSGTVSHLTAGAFSGFPLPDVGGGTTVGNLGTTCAREAGTTSAVPEGHVIAELHRAPSSIRVHRDVLPNSDRMRIGGLPLTTRRRTAIDCLTLLDWDAALSLWAWLLTRNVLTVDQLGLATRERTGRKGVPTLLRLLRLGRTGAASVAEQRLHQVLRTAGLEGWQANVPVLDADGSIAVVDVLFAEARLVIEVDGFAGHRDYDRFVADRRRHNQLVAAGYTVLRITWEDLRDHPETVVADIRAILARP